MRGQRAWSSRIARGCRRPSYGGEVEPDESHESRRRVAIRASIGLSVSVTVTGLRVCCGYS